MGNPPFRRESAERFDPGGFVAVNLNGGRSTLDGNNYNNPARCTERGVVLQKLRPRNGLATDKPIKWVPRASAEQATR